MHFIQGGCDVQDTRKELVLPPTTVHVSTMHVHASKVSCSPDVRGHLQTIVCTLSIIVTLPPDPPPPLLLTSHFVNLLKISNYVPKARAKYSSLLTKCIANMLELHLFFASFPFCCIRMKLLTSRSRPHPLQQVVHKS